MLKNFLSRYSYKYPKSLVYMLQASEYHISDFIDWYKQTKNFSDVEKRKTLDKTPKALGLLSAAWIILIGLYVLGVYLFVSYQPPESYPAVAFIIFAPYLLPYLLTAVLAIGQTLIQEPIKYFLKRKTKSKLEKHNGIKIAVAGSFGKTSMREILKTILSEDNKVAAPPDSYNTPLGIAKFVESLKGNEDILIFEFGEYYPGDIKELSKIVNPDIGVITGINEAHLKKFKNLENTINTVFEIKDFVDSKNIYINGESMPAKNNAPEESKIYSQNGIENWKIRDKKTDLSGLKFTLDTGQKEVKIKSNLLGLHQIGPIVCGAYIAHQLNMPMDKIKSGVSKTKSFDHRLEPKEQEKSITLIDDSYNGNPDGVKAAINFLSSLKDKRRIYITPGLVEMGHKEKEVHKKIGKWLAEANIEKVILIKNSVTPYIEEGLKESDYKGGITWFETGPEAYKSLKNLTVKGDVVLIQNDWPDQYN